jgi:hypothetical protein
MRFENEHVGNPGEGRKICYHSRETYLLIFVVNAERDRVFYRAPDGINRSPCRPIRITQKLMDDREIKPRFIRAD